MNLDSLIVEEPGIIKEATFSLPSSCSGRKSPMNPNSRKIVLSIDILHIFGVLFFSVEVTNYFLQTSVISWGRRIHQCFGPVLLEILELLEVILKYAGDKLHS